MTSIDSLGKSGRLGTIELRRRCDPGTLDFESTADVEPMLSIVGQDDAVDALWFGLATSAAGHNVYVRGLAGTGRMALVRQLLRDVQPYCPLSEDHCYVHDFAQPEQPMLITLPRGQGRAFGAAIDELIRFVETELGQALDSDSVRGRRRRLETDLKSALAAKTGPFEQELRQNQLALVTVQLGQTAQTTIFPLIDGQPAPPDRFEQMQQEGRITDAEASRIRERIEQWSGRLSDLHREIFALQRGHREAIRNVDADELRRVLGLATQAVLEQFPTERVQRFVTSVVANIVAAHARGPAGPNSTDLYRVNVLTSPGDDGSPIVVESRPTMANLLGTVEREFPRDGGRTPDHLLIRAGSLLRANGGYLILDARDVLTEHGAWQALTRTLRSGRLQITPSEAVFVAAHVAVKPEPIPVKVKVVLVGDESLYYALDGMDPDFPHLFKVLADFATDIPRDDSGHRRYAGVIAKVVGERGLVHFDRSGVAALIEHGARIAGRADRLTARFGRLVDIAEESSFLARRAGRDRVVADDVDHAIRRGRSRADLPARQFRERITSGAIRVRTVGAAIGQINGLAVVQAGPLTFGFPMRITASIGAGFDGTINVEAAAHLSGSIHTKGFEILGGLLRSLLPLPHPLAFRASIAFEQTYGGVDGDSASGAETVCLFSALTELPCRQDLAMTGAIDQLGNLLPIGAVAEKAEGFYDVCREIGLTGTQGVVIPRANVGDLMLRKDVLADCEAGRFHVYAADSIHQALELFLGRPAGELGDDGYPEDSVLGLALERAHEFWEFTSMSPEGLAQRMRAAQEPAAGGAPDLNNA